MLYLNSIDNAATSKTDKKYAICYEKIPAMQNIPELAPSKELLAQWESKEISWEKFRKNFMAEMKAEYRKEGEPIKKIATIYPSKRYHPPFTRAKWRTDLSRYFGRTD